MGSLGPRFTAPRSSRDELSEGIRELRDLILADKETVEVGQGVRLRHDGGFGLALRQKDRPCLEEPDSLKKVRQFGFKSLHLVQWGVEG